MSNKTEIIIDGQNKGAITAINGVETKLSGLSNQVKGPLASAFSSFSQFLPIAALTTTAYKLGDVMKSAIDTADELYKMSQKVGISVESLSTLKYAAELSDLSMNQMETSLRKLSTNLFDVANGNGKDAALAFYQLGIDVIDSNNKIKSSSDVLLEVAERFSRMEDGTNKSALAIKLFGRSGLDMIPFLNQGKQAITDLTNEAEQFGLKISTETGRQAEVFNDTLTSFRSELEGLAFEALPPLLTKLNNFATGVRDINKAVLEFSGESLFQGLFRAADNFTTMGVNLNEIIGITQLVNSEMARLSKLQEQIKKHTEDVNKEFYATFNVAYPFIVNQTNAHNNALNTQVGIVKNLNDEWSKYVERVASGKPQDDASGAGGVFPSFNELTSGFEMFMVPENPFDPFKQYTVDFVSSFQTEIEQIGSVTGTVFNNMAGAMNNFYNQGGKNARTFFQIYKAFATAQAVVTGIESVLQAYKQGMAFGGPILAGIYAATAGAFAASQIALINSASFNSKSAGSVSGAAASISSGSGGGSNQSGSNASGGGAIFNITINGLYTDGDEIARDLVPKLRKAYGDTLGTGQG